MLDKHIKFWLTKNKQNSPNSYYKLIDSLECLILLSHYYRGMSILLLEQTIFRLLNLQKSIPNTYSFHDRWNFKLFDLLSVLISNKSLNKSVKVEAKNLLFEFCENLWKRVFTKDLTINGFHSLKILKILSDNYDSKNEEEEELIERWFVYFYDEIIDLKHMSDKMRLQFFILAKRCNLSSFIEDWKKNHYSFSHLQDKNTDYSFINDLNNLDFLSSILLEDLENNFYYEINPSNNIPQHILNRSILHRKEL